MCLGIPGKIIGMVRRGKGMSTGRVDFGGVVKEISLAYVPEAGIGDYVVVHVGFAISRIDPGEAKRVFSYLQMMGETGELSAHNAEDTQ